MKKIGITADCSSCLEYAPFEHNIKITRTSINFGDQVLVDGVDIKADEFYKKLENSDIVPSTSAPTPREIIRAVEACKKEGCEIVIHFPISFGLSAYGENLQAVGDDYVDDVDLKVYNPHTACLNQGYLAHYAEILANKGYSYDEIISECDKLVNQQVSYFVVDDLKYLVKNGRLNVISGFVGSLIKIKPILRLGQSGTIDIHEKIRTHAKAIDRMFSIVEEETKNAKEVIYIVQHSNRHELAEKMAERVKNTFSNAKRVEISVVTPTVGAHIGSGLVSICYIICDGLKEDI